MAHPKRKISKTRRDKRRTHDVCLPATIMECPNCHSAVKYHHVCDSCGHYKGRQVVAVKEVA